MSTIPEPEEFHRKLLAALARTPPAPWHEIWLLFCDDPWFQDELVKQARFVLLATRGPLAWVEDIRHEVLLTLVAKLQKKPDLGINIRELGEDFPLVISTVARNASRQAFKRLRRIYRTGVGLSEQSDACGSARSFERDVRSDDLSAAIEDLPEPLCSVLRLVHVGHTILAISENLHLTYGETYRAFRHGVAQIRRDLFLP
jgi:DNA-directed RNA polymerase specialized sigma24 family protein